MFFEKTINSIIVFNLAKEDGKMKSKSLVVAIIFIMFFGSFITIFSTDISKADGNEIYVDSSFHSYGDGSAQSPYNSIQKAIDEAEDGDTIFIFNGYYDEPLVIYKNLRIWGGTEGETIIDAKSSKRNTIEITADHAELINCTVSDRRNYKTSPIGALIYVNANNVKITGNIVNRTESWGIHLDTSSGDCVINNNIINDTKKGINIYSSDTNDILNNHISNCSEYGIHTSFSQNNRIYNNNISNSSYHCYSCIYLKHK